MKLHIFLLSFFLLIVGSIFLLTTRHTGAQEKNQQAYDVACEVTDVPSLKDCMKKAKNNEVDLVKIMKIVECVSKDDCAVDLSNIQRAVKIYGINNTDTGFKRVENFDYSLFTIKGSKDIVIGSFLVDDIAEGDCTVTGSACPPVMSVDGSTNIVIDQLRIHAAKSTALSVMNSSSITIKNSVFIDNSSAALTISTNGGENVVDNNTFSHNHKDSEGCLGICTNAQVYILPDAKNITMSKNIIKDGRIDLYDALGLYASGVDISAVNVDNVLLSCNTISNNQGNGIVIDQQQPSTKRIIIEKNSIYGNGINFNLFALPQNSIQNNCVVDFCKVDGC